MPNVVVSKELTLTFSDEQWNAVTAALAADRKIEAVKIIWKILPKASLADAKSYVEKIENDLREKFPEKFTANRRGSPMLPDWLFLVIVAVIGIVIIEFLLVFAKINGSSSRH
jgi:hypothetical protein